MRILLLAIIGILQFQAAVGLLHAETGRDAWLRYMPLDENAQEKYVSLPASVVVLGDSDVLGSAQKEMIRGVRGLLGRTLRAEKEPPKEPPARCIAYPFTPPSICRSTQASVASRASHLTRP